MKTIIKRLPIALMVAFVVVFFTACNKEKTVTKNDTIAAEDDNDAIEAMNTAMDDAANAVAEIPSGKTGDEGDDDGLRLCGATIDWTHRNEGVVTINYSGNECFGHLERSGSITITMINYTSGVRWKDQGAVIQVDFNDVTILNKRSGNSHTFNGSHLLTNVTGGYSWEVMWGLTTRTIIYKHTSSDFLVSFSDGTVRTWNVNRTKTFANTNGLKTVSIAGEASVNGMFNVAVWGTNRNNESFTGTLVEPIVSNTRCGIYKPISGEFLYTVGNRSVHMLFGVDKEGNPVSTDACAYGFRLSTSQDAIGKTRVVAYGGNDRK